jgi:nucleoid-associated protein YgaU
MDRAKLQIWYEKDEEGKFLTEHVINVLFNPTQLAYSRSVTWSPLYTVGRSKSSPGFGLQYQSSAPETLTLELFFDTYATSSVTESGTLGLLPSARPAIQSVLPDIKAVASLASIDPKLHRPPVCRLGWGEVTLFQGVLQQATRTLLLFLEDGTPVRATMNCTFMEYPGIPGATSEGSSAAVTGQYVVQAGDTLMSIAITRYGDASLWRKIADANHITNPRLLQVGQTLTLPPPSSITPP